MPGAKLITFHPRQGFHFTSSKPLALTALRNLFDEQATWENTETLGGSLQLLPINLDEDPRLETVIVELDHGKRSVFVVDPAAQ